MDNYKNAGWSENVERFVNSRARIVGRKWSYFLLKL